VFGASCAEENLIIQCLKASEIQLEDLTIVSDNSISPDALRFILQQKQMKRLKISHDIKTNLTSLIKKIGRENCGLENVEDFESDYNFNNTSSFVSLMTNLCELSLQSISNESNFFEFILDQSCFPRLTKLHLEDLDEDFVINVINTNITELKLEDCLEIKSILLALKGLKKLTIIKSNQHLTNEFVEFIAVNMNNLEEITANCEAATTLQYYEEMKRQRDDINKKIQFNFILQRLSSVEGCID
jgi:hypothetical protein